MALTNFAALTDEQLTVWSRDLWRAARNASFVAGFMGSGPNAMIQRVSELRKTEKGARAVITLVADLENDGVVGDNQLEGFEEASRAYDQVILVDQLRHGTRLKGRLADQKSVVDFRETARDNLAYWLADRIDQLAFLTLSGVSYTKRNDGATRTNSQLADLEFAASVVAPSANRRRRWDSTTGTLKAADTTAIKPADTPSYKMLVAAKAYAKSQYIRGIRGSGNSEYYHVFMHPMGMAKLKQDTDYLANLRGAGVRGSDNPLFEGSVVTVDGLVIHEFRHVCTTLGHSSPPWGNSTDGMTHGQHVLFCGAQALAFADIGNPYWVEETFDYGNSHGISVGKMLGMLKPRFRSAATGTIEDFGVLVIDTAI